MPEVADYPRVRRDRHSALVAASLVCLAAPCLALLVLSSAGSGPRTNAAWLAGTLVAGAVLPFLHWSPYRGLGLAPFAAVAWLAAAAHGVYWNEWPGWAHGLALGVLVGALARGRRGSDPLPEAVLPVGATLAGLGLAWALQIGGRPSEVAGWVVLACAMLLVVWMLARLFRPAFEASLEPLMWVLYRIRGVGPGLADFPRTGPCIVLANHAAWLDPIFLGKVLPRPITPMMISRFYDLPIIRRLMVAFGVIRVPEKALKKDAPELQEAIAALDRGECVVIFPEGYLRRSEEKPLRRFGQGIWQVLKARPATPVFATWIEGGWGSYTSYFNGKPTTNKKPDVRRAVGVAVSAAVVVPPELLADHLDTRVYLMNLVLRAREHLGLEPLPPYLLPDRSEASDDDTP